MFGSRAFDRNAHGQVVRPTSGRRGYDAEPDDVLGALRELQADLPGTRRPRPEERARRPHLACRNAVGERRRRWCRAAGDRQYGADGCGCDEPHAATLTKWAQTVDRDDVRRIFMVIAVAAAVALPVGAQAGSSWVRHQGEGFSLELPASWADESKDRARLIREVRRLATDEPQAAALMDSLLSAGNTNVAVKMIAFDLAPSSLGSGFATNLNVVAERTRCRWRRGAKRR